MEIFNYSQKSPDAVAQEFGSDPQKGLDKKTVADRITKYGPNKLAIKETTGWYIFLRQFKSSFVYLLLGAMAITLFLGETVDTLMIFLFMLMMIGLKRYTHCLKD